MSDKSYLKLFGWTLYIFVCKWERDVQVMIYTYKAYFFMILRIKFMPVGEVPTLSQKCREISK